MLRFLYYILNTFAFICGGAILLMFLMQEWLLIKDNFWQFINPLLHLQVLFSLLAYIPFWIFSVIGIASSVGASKIDENLRYKLNI